MSSGVIARTILLDRMVREYIDKNPDSVIINIACGMDTRFYRSDNGKIRWYNIDLPVTINVRSRFLKESGRVVNIAKSATDESRADDIEKTAPSYLVVIEGLSMYLSKKDIKKILAIISGNFGNVTLYMETMSPMVVKNVKEKSIEASNAKFTWGISNGKELESYNSAFKLVRDDSLTEGMKELYPVYKLISKIGFVRKISNKITVMTADTNSHRE
ncbi:MAG: class I SAM-dependent methyltransferase [Ruminococcus sp.]|nr:class I SAM-dependent methyltransferase [Ruminococcus sp.]